MSQENDDFEPFLAKKKKKNKITQQEPQSQPNQDGDYSYMELLERIYNQLIERNPDTTQIQLHLPPPIIALVGSKRTAFVNFDVYLKILHRQEDHLKKYIETELNTVSSIRATSQLIIKGRFKPMQMQSIMRSYINDYVACSACKKLDTIIIKDPITRLYFLTCNDCGSKYCVKPFVH